MGSWRLDYGRDHLVELFLVLPRLLHLPARAQKHLEVQRVAIELTPDCDEAVTCGQGSNELTLGLELPHLLDWGDEGGLRGRDDAPHVEAVLC